MDDYVKYGHAWINRGAEDNDITNYPRFRHERQLVLPCFARQNVCQTTIYR